MSPDEQFPQFDRTERDRRWARARAVMRDRDLRGLIFFGGLHDRTDVYFARESIPGALVYLPLEGEPMIATIIGGAAMLRHDEQGRALVDSRWIDDLRVGPPPLLLADRLRSDGASTARVGAVGLSSMLGVSSALWGAITGLNPTVTWVDVSDDIAQERLVKSRAELDMFRHAARIGEHASRAFLDAAVVGARESDVYAAVEHEILRRGGHTTWPGMILRSGGPLFGGFTEWGWAGGEPPRLHPGGAIGAEIFGCYGGMDSQQQMHVRFGTDAEHDRLADAAHEAYLQGVQALRPGAMFSEVAAAMHEPVIEAGFWSRAPMIQTVAPGTYNSAMWVNTRAQTDLHGLPITHGLPADGEFEIAPGMTFALQPSAIAGVRQVCVGGSVITTDGDCETLNSLALRSHIVR
ncbi:M24 family metallopeptidase [Microbacterium lacus]|uniref:M24 family metallopeptidase n=1 Tax=Microbacterium lacus TaxID=415217 RepID=UPI00384E12A2